MQKPVVPPEVIVEPFRPHKVPLFLSQAAKEGWRCEEWEFRFVLEVFPSGCWVARNDGRVSGFVTSIKYDRSGWIGNLLVGQKVRGQGLGRLLMERAIGSLAEAGASTIWLTASEAGQPLYEKLGFVAMDRISRWRGRGDSRGLLTGTRCGVAAVAELDRLGWGDDRSLIINRVAANGPILETCGGFCIVQAGADGVQLGPWGCRTEEQAVDLLDQALTVAGSKNVFLDSPDANETAAKVLHGKGFVPCGKTVLMYRGMKPAYRPEYIYALASMGSMG